MAPQDRRTVVLASAAALALVGLGLFWWVNSGARGGSRGSSGSASAAAKAGTTAGGKVRHDRRQHYLT
jgi:hypothetical protein